MKIDADWRPLIRAAEEQGWTVKPSKRGHNACHLVPPDKTKAIVAIPSTPGKRNRGLKNKISELRRSGLSI